MINAPRTALRVWPLLALALQACGTGPGTVQRLLRVHASTATAPWLSEVYACAPHGTAIEITGPGSAEVDLRLGEPSRLVEPAYQIGSDDLVVVVHPLTAVGHLTADQVAALFAGQVSNWQQLGGADLAVQLWTYSVGEDVQEDFDRAILKGRPVASVARVVFSAQDMSDSVGMTPGSAGLLPRRWKAGNTREVFSLPGLPVLAVLQTSPDAQLGKLLSCLQSS